MRSQPTRSARSFRTKYIIAAIIPAVLLSLSVTGFVWAQKQVTVVVDGRASHLNTQAKDVAGVLRQARVGLSKGDVLTPRADIEVTDGMTVVVRHAIPVTVRLGDEQTRVDVVGTTVADALMAAGADISPDAEVTPALDTKLVAGMLITAPQRFARVKTVDVVVPFKTETFSDSSLPRGTRQIIVAGSNGLKMQVTKAIVTDGVEGPSTVTAEKVVTPPVGAARGHRAGCVEQVRRRRPAHPGEARPAVRPSHRPVTGCAWSRPPTRPTSRAAAVARARRWDTRRSSASSLSTRASFRSAAASTWWATATRWPTTPAATSRATASTCASTPVASASDWGRKSVTVIVLD